MSIDILLIGPNKKYTHGPAKGFELLCAGLVQNGYKIKVISGYNASLLNFIYIFFVKKIYIISFPEILLLILVSIFKKKKFIIGADIPLLHIKISSYTYRNKNVLKIFNTPEIMEYYINKYHLKTGNKGIVHGHGINTNIGTISENKESIFIYYKNINSYSYEKTLQIKNQVLQFLKKEGINYTYIEYGKYTYPDWGKILKTHKLGIFITSVEGYGLAKLECLNYDIPILNFEQNEAVTIRGEILKNRSTFPIFEPGFGEKFYNIKDFQKNFIKIKSKKYNTRDIILKKYDYIKKSRDLMSLYEKIKI